MGSRSSRRLSARGSVGLERGGEARRSLAQPLRRDAAPAREIGMREGQGIEGQRVAKALVPDSALARHLEQPLRFRPARAVSKAASARGIVVRGGPVPDSAASARASAMASSRAVRVPDPMEK